MTSKRIIKIGVDFDGVLVYNAFRILRAPVKWFKREVLGIRRLTFFVPQNWWQKWIWIIVHESSVFPANGVELLKKLKNRGGYEFHLVTGRYGFLKSNLYQWLERHDLISVFASVNVNENYDQPHLFKEKVVTKLRLDYYLEDNLDIVEYLRQKKSVKVLWIYNILDRNKQVEDKFPDLKRALETIIK